jgi:Bacterial Ig-like domain (group 3)/Abnormal spindle-like microcephaly-assoc'd, ASPM-SPD-2-Hydin
VGNPGTAGAGNGDLDKVDRSQGAIAFGQQIVGTASAAQNVAIYNGGNQQLTITDITLTDSNSGFNLQPATIDNCTNSAVLEPGAYCQVAVTLKPLHAGTLTGSISFNTNSLNNPDSTTTVALSGFVPGPYAALSPNPIAFGNQAVAATSAATSAILSNSGTVALTGMSISLAGTDPSDFAITTGTNACGSSLAVGSSCSIYVTFTPQAALGYTATLSVADNAPGSSQTITLTGTGTGASIVNIAINEAVHIADTPVAGRAVAINVVEAVHVADAPLFEAPLTLNIAEVIHTTDVPVPAPTASLNVAEIIHTSDAPMLAPTAVLNDNEVIHTTDADALSPTLDLNVAEIIHTTDVFTDKILTTPTKTVLISSVNPSVAGQSVTFTATASATTAAAGIPTGTVQFSVNGTPAGAPVPLNGSGQALYSTTALGDGDNSIGAAYSGSGAFLSSDAAALMQLVLDFGFTTGSAQSATVFPGQSASFKFAIAPKGTFSDTITFSASGLPPGATASFNPAALTPGSNATDVILTVQTAQTSAAVRPVQPWSATPAVLLGLLFPLFAIGRARRMLKHRARFLTAVVSLGVALAISGCAGGGFFNQPAKTYTITVTATSGALQHSTTVNLTVQ